MMILPLADALQNCLQDLTSRIAGVDNEQMAGRAMGMGAMLGYGIGAIKEQFNSPSSNIKADNTNNENNNGGLKGFISRAKSVINPNMNLSDAVDYNGNSNPIREVIPNSNFENVNNKNAIKDTTPKETMSKVKSVAGNVARTGYNATKTYLKVGANMAEGNFYMNNNKSYNQSNRKNNYKKEFQKTEYTNNTNRVMPIEKGDDNEFKG